MGLIIQRASAADAHNIAVLSQQTFYDTFADFNSKEDMAKFMNESFSIEKLVAEFNDPRNIFLTAFINEELAGYAKITDSKNPDQLGTVDAIEINRIYAAQKAIGQGVGKALMEECLNIAILKSREWVWLGVWEKNERAISFYKKFGFEKFGEHDFVLGVDVQADWLMKKKL